MTAAPAHRDRYMRQLDGLRLFAVLAVMVEHWRPFPNRLGLPIGNAGVTLFFVLSGFLITGILLRARDEADAVGQPVRVTLWRFYVRRFLRIFPLYYVAVIVAAIFLVEGRELLWPNLLYLSNVAQFNGANARSVTLFWSLAVEEQFYLAWPFAMLLVPRRLLLPAIVATIATAPIFRVAMELTSPGRPLVFMLPISCLDALGLGSLLALLRMKEHGSRRFERACLIVGGVAWIAIRGLKIAKHLPAPIAPLESTAYALVFAWLIGRTADGFKGTVGRALSLGPIVYLGTISYGLYVLHTLTEFVVIKPIRLYPVPAVMAQPQLKFVLLLSATAALASLSWFLYERPINRLKRFFPYVRKRGATTARVAPAELTPTSASAGPASARG